MPIDALSDDLTIHCDKYLNERVRIDPEKLETIKKEFDYKGQFYDALKSYEALFEKEEQERIKEEPEGIFNVEVGPDELPF